MATRQKLLDDARRSPAGWHKEILDRLYATWGFEIAEGSKHTKYRHPVHQDLRAVITRASGEVSKSYVTDAVALIEELIAREQRP